MSKFSSLANASMLSALRVTGPLAATTFAALILLTTPAQGIEYVISPMTLLRGYGCSHRSAPSGVATFPAALSPTGRSAS